MIMKKLAALALVLVLPSLALAASACRLLRLRLAAEAVPAGWASITPPKSRSRVDGDAILPVARLLLDGREVWVCVRPTRGQWLLIEPPFPAEAGRSSEAVATLPSGIFGRLRQQIGQGLGGVAESQSPWLARQVRGRLVWEACYPFGTDGRVTLYTLQQPEWVDEPDDLERLKVFRQMLAGGTLQNGAYVVAFSGGLRVMELDRKDTASYIWLDRTAAEAFQTRTSEKAWAIVWLDGAAVVPVALLTPSAPGNPPRLTHLIPGTPTDVLVVPS
jgi:hypothetical protein